ncbi:GIY-YIG nuclease family protein [Prochlorococcus sp. MIT 1223]|uniref:GIY-YIG nuclease family protein n=1 Tax=Prochlorococcus sp. MIT 1223 TaxID=3096217 RepID=UPI002A755E42|nr:GIY-YIG nuclease family protein [Prochlorococcus sp. MIT 1223]
MSGYVYLVRNADLYMIGRTNELEKKIKSLKPDEIIKTLKVDDPRYLQARLFRRYKSKRIPDTNYFRLTNDQLVDCSNHLSSKGYLPSTLAAEVTIGLTASLLLFVIAFVIAMCLGKGLANSFAFSLPIGSIPMWSLFFIGSFGGYDIKDLPLFSSWINRAKALVYAIIITSFSYFTFSFLTNINT